MRLVDFGSAFRADHGKLVPRKGTGTIAYSAPEVISGKVCGVVVSLCKFVGCVGLGGGGARLEETKEKEGVVRLTF